jgi:hypothetical protein
METITLTNTFTDDPQYKPCTKLTIDTTLSLGRTISDTPSNTSSLSLWFKIEESAILKLGTANDCLKIATDGTLTLVANGTSSSNFQDAASKDVIAIAGNWHHLAWIKNNDEHTLYLNGIACQTQTLAGAPNPATIDTITSVGANAYVVHMHGYDRALEATEVVADKMSQYNATKSFTDQYPLNFTLKDRSVALEMSDDKLIIEDITAKERTYQRLVITNVSGEALRFVEGTGEVSNTNYHFELRFRNGTFVSPSEYPKFDNFKTENLLEGEPSGIPSGWQATLPYQNPQDGSWSVYVLRTVALEVAPNGTLEFLFEYTTADGSLGGRSTRVTLGYQQMEYADADDAQAVAGIREKQIDIINNSSNNAHVSALNEKVTKADARVEKLENESKNALNNLDLLFGSFFSEESTVKNKDGEKVANPIKAAKNEAIAKAEEKATNAKNEAIDESNRQASDANSDSYNKAPSKQNNRIKPLPTLNKASLKALFGGILNALGTLASNIKAVDDEVDKRGDAQDAINNKLEKPFPLVASVSAPEGVVCGDFGTSLVFKLTNIDNSKAISFNSNSEFRFIFPKGTTSADLVTHDNKAGNGNNGLEKSSSGSSSNTVVFTWDPPSGREIAPRTSETFTISGITPNSKVGFVTIFIEYQGIVGYPSGKLSVGVSKISEDISQLVGGGNVGIGTNDPKSKLDVEGGVAIGAAYSGIHAAPTNGLLVEGNVGIGTTSTNTRLHVHGESGQDAFRVQINKSSKLYTLSNGGTGIGNYSTTVPKNGLYVYGNVGIGTTSPKAKLEVAGNTSLDGTLDVTGEATLSNTLTVSGTGDSSFAGNVGIGTTSPSAKLHISSGTSGDAILLLEADTDDNNEYDNPMIQLRQDNGTVGINIGFDQANFGGNKFGIGRRYTNDYYDTFIIDTANGNVGIGTTSPSAKLEVNGDIKIDGQLYIKDPTHVDTRGISGWYRLSEWGSGSIKRKVEWRISDFRLKEEITPLTSILEKVFRLNPVSYKWNDQGLLKLTEHIRKDFISETGKNEDNEKLWKSREAKLRKEHSGFYKGFIAQELETVFPEWVQEGEDGYKTIDTSELTTVLVEALKELKNEKDVEIYSLKEENKKQVELLNKQQQQFADLSAKVEQLLRK